MNTIVQRAARRGFTLIELLAVIAIIITLVGIIVAGAGYAQRASQRAQAKAQLQQICLAIEKYKNEYGNYPAQMTNAAVWGKLTNFVDRITATDPWGLGWNYKRDARAGYYVWSLGPDASNGTPDDVSNKAGD